MRGPRRLEARFGRLCRPRPDEREQLDEDLVDERDPKPANVIVDEPERNDAA